MKRLTVQINVTAIGDYDEKTGHLMLTDIEDEEMNEIDDDSGEPFKYGDLKQWNWSPSAWEHVGINRAL